MVDTEMVTLSRSELSRIIRDAIVEVRAGIGTACDLDADLLIKTDGLLTREQSEVLQLEARKALAGGDPARCSIMNDRLMRSRRARAEAL